MKNISQKSTMRAKKNSNLTVRERRFAAGVVKGLTPTEAMRQAGYAESTALSKQGQKSEKVRDFIVELMDEQGLSLRELLEVLKDGLGATKQIALPDMSIMEVPDYAVRHKFLETALKLRGYLQKQEVNLSNPGSGPLKVTVNFVRTTIAGEVEPLQHSDLSGFTALQ